MCTEQDLTGWLEAHGFALVADEWVSPSRVVRVIPGSPITTVVRYADVRPWESWRVQFGPDTPLTVIAQVISAGTHHCPHCGTDQPVWAMEPFNLAGNMACRDIGACTTRIMRSANGQVTS